MSGEPTGFRGGPLRREPVLRGRLPSITLYRLRDPGPLRTEDLKGLLVPERGAREVALTGGFPGRLFVSRSKPIVPEWAEYLRPLTLSRMEAGARENMGAVLFVWPYKNRRICYVATWGTGHFLVRDDVVHRDLGLRAALNLMAAASADWDPNRVRAVRTKRVGSTTLISQIQASKKSTVDAFPISLEGDQLRQLTGSPLDPDLWGSTITGGASFHIKRPEKAHGLVDLCKRVEAAYRADSYKVRYAWIDNVSPINDLNLAARAFEIIIARLNDSRLDLTVSPPDLVSWEGVDHFEYHCGNDKVEIEEPSKASFLTFCKEAGFLPTLSQAILTERMKLSVVDDTGERVATWPMSRCLSVEITMAGSTYVLDEGGLFGIAADYLQTVDSYIRSIPESGISFPRPMTGMKEGPYNVDTANTLPGALLLDLKTIVRPSASPVEVCDIALASRKLVHLKRGRSSASLSHLFAQGTISADLLHMDSAFRMEVRRRIAKSPQGSGATSLKRFEWLHSEPFPTTSCMVAYAILTGSPRVLRTVDLPFFSKINLRQRCQDLRRMGFSYALDLIPSS